MIVNKTVLKDIAILKIKGDFSFNELEQFQEVITPIIVTYNNIAVDISEADFSDMTIFGEFIKIASILRERNGKFYIIKITPELRKYIQKSKIDSLVILTSEDEIMKNYS